MKFKVKALSNLIFIASSNTEGNIRYLDFIPGSVFLGIVANNYDKFKNPFDVFFSGKVRFSDANIIINQKPSLRIPLIFYYEKLNKQNILNYAFLTKEDFKVQYKQIREGYFNEDFEIKKIEFDYSQKSARDYDTGRSKKSAMYGFRSITKGSEFYFKVEVDDIDEDDKKLIKDSLLGIKLAGKSKRTEYGLIEISEADFDEYNKTTKNSSYDFIYFKSRVVLFDKNGNPTYDVVNIHPELKKENIEYKLNQIRYYEYTPYNFIRKEDTQRCVIEKGSVVVLKNVSKKVLDEIANGIGGFRSEGFGEVLINPQFLSKKYIEFKTPIQSVNLETENVNTKLIKYLKNRQLQKQDTATLIIEVKKCIEEKEKWFFNISKSQWGNIRILSSFNDYDERIINYISRGVFRWREDQINIMKNILKNNKEFIALFATLMMKKAKK